jgi:hypothetical protein
VGLRYREGVSNREWRTGRGGAIDGPGPVIAGGLLFVNSGYGTFGQMPGNLLQAFGVGPR